MTQQSAVRRGAAAGPRGEPALAFAVTLLWCLLALFVLYPIAMLLARVFVDKGHFTLGGLAAVVGDRHQIAAFGNSLLLGTLVGTLGTSPGLRLCVHRRAVPLVAAHDPPGRHRRVAAPCFSALHDRDRLHLLVRSARPHQLRPARHQGVGRLRHGKHADRRGLDVFPDRLPRPATACWRRSTRTSKAWPCRSAHRAAACFEP